MPPQLLYWLKCSAHLLLVEFQPYRSHCYHNGPETAISGSASHFGGFATISVLSPSLMGMYLLLTLERFLAITSLFVCGVLVWADRTNTKLSNLTCEEWNSNFASDVFFAFPTNEDLLAETTRLWDYASDNKHMVYVVRTSGPRNSGTTRELENLLDEGGHYEFVGGSNYYTAFMTRSQAYGLLTSETFDIVAPVPALLKLSTEVLEKIKSVSRQPSPLAFSKGSAEPFKLHISMSSGSHVDSAVLAERWHEYLDSSGVGRRLSTSPTPATAVPGPDTNGSPPGWGAAASPLGFDARSLHQVIPLDHLTGEELSAMAKWLGSQGEVEFIEPHYPASLRNKYASWVTQTNQPGNTLLWDKGLKGEGQVVGVSDTGIDMAHCYFRHSLESTGGVEKGCNPWDSEKGDHRCRKVVQYITYEDEWDNVYPKEGETEEETVAHGTHVAASVAGLDIEGGRSYQGMAPNAKIAFFDAGNKARFEPPKDISKILTPAYNAKARIMSMSWGSASPGYTADAKSVDQFMYDHQDVVILVAAGNDAVELGDGSIGSPATAKSVITVGASANAGESFLGGDLPFNQEVLAPFSSFGPTAEGLLKPDICAPGLYIRSAQHKSLDGNSEKGGERSCDTTEALGTSMSTPVVAGNLALARQYFMEGFYPSGTKEEAKGFIPSGALLKAVAVLGAQPLKSYSDANGDSNGVELEYPDNHQGYGRLQMDRSLYFRGHSSSGLYVEGDVKEGQQPIIGQEGGEKQREIPFEVANGHKHAPFRVVLAWTDKPSSRIGRQGAALTNDLDLEVSDGTTTYYPDYYPKGVDTVNSLEVVTIPGKSGVTTYTVKITASKMGTSDGQAYALAVTGRFGNGPLQAVQAPRSVEGQSGGVPGFIADNALYALLVGGLAMFGLGTSKLIRRYGGTPEEDKFLQRASIMGWYNESRGRGSLLNRVSTTFRRSRNPPAPLRSPPSHPPPPAPPAPSAVPGFPPVPPPPRPVERITTRVRFPGEADELDRPDSTFEFINPMMLMKQNRG